MSVFTPTSSNRPIYDNFTPAVAKELDIHLIADNYCTHKHAKVKERPRGANHGGKNSKKQGELRSKVIEATTQTTPKDAHMVVPVDGTASEHDPQLR